MTDETFYTGVCGEHVGWGETPAGCGGWYALQARSITVVRWAGANRHWEWQVFGLCPHCGHTVLGHYCQSPPVGKPAQVAGLLDAGAAATVIDRPAELDETARRQAWPAFTGEDEIMAHLLLGDDEWSAGVPDQLRKWERRT